MGATRDMCHHLLQFGASLSKVADIKWEYPTSDFGWKTAFGLGLELEQQPILSI